MLPAETGDCLDAGGFPVSKPWDEKLSTGTAGTYLATEVHTLQTLQTLHRPSHLRQ